MKNLVIFLGLLIGMMSATAEFVFGQGMVYQTHQEMSLAAADGLMETWVQLPSDDYVRVTTNGSSVTLESTAGWDVTWSNVNMPCIAQYNGTIWCAVGQIGGQTTTIGGTTHPAPPSGEAYTILVKLSSTGSVLGSWQATGNMILKNIIVKDNTEIAVVGEAYLSLEHLTSPNGGGVVLIHNGTNWDTSKGFFIERPSGGFSPVVLSGHYRSNGQLVIAGITQGGTVSFGGISLPPHGGYDGFRGEITSSGVGIFVVQMAGNGDEDKTLQITKADGSFMVSGTYTQAITFYNADGTVGGSLGQFPTGASHDHIYFAYYSASGVFQSAHVAYNSGMTTDMINIDLVYGNNSFYAMIGNTNGGTVTTPTGTHDRVAPIILKFDGAGNPVWSKQVENLGSAQPVQYGEEILIEGDIVSICGTEYVSCDIDFDIPVVGISNTSFWAEYFDGIVVGPTADFSGNPTSVEEGQSVTYTDLSSDGTNPITSWNWTFEGGTPGTFSGQNPPAIAYATAGTYDVTLVVSDGSQADTELKTDYITVNSATPPTADFSGTPLNGEAPLEVSFTDLSVAGTNPITSWTWSFEGGTPGTFSGQNPPAIAYAIAGTYDVTLMVSDGSLSDTETKVDYVVVSAPAPTASYTPDVTQVSATAGNVYSDFETNEVSAVNVLSGDVGAAVSPINLGTGTTNVELSYPANLDLAAKQFIVTATTAPNNLVVTWTVNQDGTTPSMELNPSSAAVNADITSVSTVLSTQSDMTWTVDDSGLPTGWSVAPMSGTGNDTFVVTLTVNTGTDPINGSFSINGTGLGAGTTVTFPITQLGAGAPLVASAASDKSEYFIGETMQLYGSATGGTGSYSYEWTGTGGFTSSLQNPTFEPMNVGTYTFTVVVDDGENTDTDNVVVTVDELSIYLESSTQNALTGVPVTFTIFAELKDGSLASVDEVIFETDGDELTGFVNPWEFEYVYQNIGGSPYDVEVTVITSTGFIMNVSYPNYMDVIVSVGEQPTKNSIEIYPNPTFGKLFIGTQERLERVSVVNESGNELLSITNPKKSISLDLSHLPSGTYMIQLSTRDKTIVEKVVKL